jgi:hypothetical protein
LSGENGPSLITLRLKSSRVELVNERLGATLPGLESEVDRPVLVTIDEKVVRRRYLPE